VEPSPDLFLDAANQFGIAIAVLLAVAVFGGFAVVKEWIVGGKTHRDALAREKARGDALEKLYRDSAGLNEEQLHSNKVALELAKILADKKGA
jgi:hypothetical protein